MPWTAASLYYKMILHASFFCKKTPQKTKKRIFSCSPLLPPLKYTQPHPPTPGRELKRQKAEDPHLYTPAICTPPSQLSHPQSPKSHPITIAQFHTLNTHSYLTNILITPILPFVMTAGLAAMILAPLPILGAAVMQWALYSAQALISVVAFCGELPAAYLPAQRPQPAERLAILSTGYGESACQLGNGGLLIAMGNEQTARFSIEPALFHAGYTPAALLLPRPSARRSELATVFGGTWPQLKVLDTTELAGKTTLTTNAGVFTIYAPPATLPRKPMDNATPIVVWQRSKDRVLYVGDASLLTFESIPAEERRADILILGRNKRMPLVDADTIRSIGATCIILLPSAGGGSPDVQSLHPAEVVRVPLAPSIYFCDENVQTSH